MNTYIALLKGINVGGHKKVPMAELRQLLHDNNLKSIKTYIQSGNVIFQSSENNISTIENLIAKVIQDHFGFEVKVLVKKRSDLEVIFQSSPFPENKKKNSYFMLLHSAPSEDLVSIASEKLYEGEEYYIIENCIYYHTNHGYGRSKFNMSFFEHKLKTFATARNYNTMVKLLSLSAESPYND